MLTSSLHKNGEHVRGMPPPPPLLQWHIWVWIRDLWGTGEKRVDLCGIFSPLRSLQPRSWSAWLLLPLPAIVGPSWSSIKLDLHTLAQPDFCFYCHRRSGCMSAVLPLVPPCPAGLLHPSNPSFPLGHFVVWSLLFCLPPDHLPSVSSYFS